MRKLITVAFVCITVLNNPLKAQYYFYDNTYYQNAIVYEFGFSAGVMNSLTDLGGKSGTGKNFVKDMRWKTAKPSFGGYFLANYVDKLSLRLEATFGEVIGFDSILKAVAHTTYGRYERNLSFKSRITEFQLALEIHPLRFFRYEDRDPPLISPYAIIGTAYYAFDPQAYLNGHWYRLQPLSLEGQGFAEYPDRKPYKLRQMNICGGLGLKYEISPLFNARLEMVHRKLFTDYLDDASTNYIDPSLFYDYLPANKAAIAQQLFDRKGEITPGDESKSYYQRGDPRDNDSYFNVQIKIGIILGRQQK